MDFLPMVRLLIIIGVVIIGGGIIFDVLFTYQKQME